MPTHFTIDDLRKSACAGLNEHLFTPPVKKVKGPKYKNKKVEWNGILFDSTKEYHRYRALLLLVKASAIGQLQRQVKYLLIPANDHEKKSEYWADFVYISAATGETVVEDVKSEATRKLSTYIMKRKLMLSVHNIKIKEV